MEITKHQLMTESASMFLRLWRSGNDAGEGFAPDDTSWYKPRYYVGRQGALDIYMHEDDLVFAVGDSNGPWAVCIAYIVD
jgi:hypothetical protein